MKVRDSLKIDLVYSTLQDKLMNFINGRYRYTGIWDATQFVKSSFPSWQYNGTAPMEEIMLWCEEHLGNDWIWNFETIYFKTKEDKVFFSLRWPQ